MNITRALDDALVARARELARQQGTKGPLSFSSSGTKSSDIPAGVRSRAKMLTKGCDRLLTEDLQDGQIIEGVRIANPFASAFVP
jgi:hypothetical protein